MDDDTTKKSSTADWQAWLKEPLTVTYPKWVFLGVGLLGLVLLFAALD